MSLGDHDPRRRAGLESLLGSGEQPASSDLRADPLAASEHARHGDMAQPLEDFDQGRARTVCGEITRRTLLDFAPALLLLDPHARLRAQALIAYTRTLFDFTTDHGLEGERLAQINRWQFTLDLSLEGQPVGQPIFVFMAAQDARRQWRRQDLDRLAALARNRISRPPAATADLHRQLKGLAGAVASLLFGIETSGRLEEIGAALMRAHSLASGSRELPLLRPDLASPTTDTGDAMPAESLRLERAELRRLLRVKEGDLAGLPTKARRAVLYACYAARSIIESEPTMGESSSAQRQGARIGAWQRARLVLKARWS